MSKQDKMKRHKGGFREHQDIQAARHQRIHFKQFVNELKEDELDEANNFSGFKKEMMENKNFIGEHPFVIGDTVMIADEHVACRDYGIWYNTEALVKKFGPYQRSASGKRWQLITVVIEDGDRKVEINVDSRDLSPITDDKDDKDNNDK